MYTNTQTVAELAEAIAKMREGGSLSAAMADDRTRCVHLKVIGGTMACVAVQPEGTDAREFVRTQLGRPGENNRFNVVPGDYPIIAKTPQAAISLE